MKRTLILLLALACIFTANPIKAVPTGLQGYWKGALRSKTGSAPWGISLHIQQQGKSIQVFLDIPSMVLYHKSLQVTQDKKTKITFPFGLGDFEVSLKGDSLAGTNPDFVLGCVRAQEILHTQKEVSWNNGPVKLAGTLYFPRGDKKVPLMVMTHGAGIGNRNKWEYSSWAYFYLQRGFAVLLYDRRGNGASTGDRENATLAELSKDLQLGIEMAKQEPGIDAAKIGVGGGSQAAYLAFMAAPANNDIKFMVLSGAPAVRVDEQQIHNTIYEMRYKKEAESSIDSALAYMRLYFYCVASGNDWPVLEKMARKAETTQWGKYVDQPLVESGLDWWKINYNVYRPNEILPKINIPVLLMYGENDFIVPPQENVGLMQHYFNRNGKQLASIKVFKNADHGLETPFYRGMDGHLHWPGKPAEFEEVVDNWLRQQNLMP